MRINPKRLRRMSPAQLGLLAVIVIALLLFEYFTQNQPGQAPESPQRNPSPTSPAATPSPQPAGATSTGAAIATRTVISATTRTPTKAGAVAQPSGNFDYFVLALSWSPDYCATDGQNDAQQCSLGKKLGFVLHGLWPQNNQGYPSNCSTEKLPAAVKAQFPGLFPNDSLADHEWEKHGTCSGLNPAAYLAYSRQIKESVTIPAEFRAPASPFRTTTTELVQKFTQANPGFSGTTFAVNCSSNGRYLKELYVCFARDGSPQACSMEVQKDAARTCQNPDFLVRNIR